jgi:hypothetical protein
MEREEKYGKRVKGRENLEYVLGTLLLMCKTYVLFMDRPKLRPASPSATSYPIQPPVVGPSSSNLLFTSEMTAPLPIASNPLRRAAPLPHHAARSSTTPPSLGQSTAGVG